MSDSMVDRMMPVPVDPTLQGRYKVRFTSPNWPEGTSYDRQMAVIPHPGDYVTFPTTFIKTEQPSEYEVESRNWILTKELPPDVVVIVVPLFAD